MYLPFGTGIMVILLPLFVSSGIICVAHVVCTAWSIESSPVSMQQLDGRACTELTHAPVFRLLYISCIVYLMPVFLSTWGGNSSL